jgi:VWFA-related protein
VRITEIKILKLIIIVLVVNIFCLTATEAQSNGFASKILRIESGNFPEINVTLKVFTKEPASFNSDNFKLFEEDTKVASFSVKATKLTQYVMLALDRSSSIENQMPEVKKAAAVFINTMPKRVKAGIISFASDVQSEHECSDDKNSLYKAIQKIRPYGGTSLYDVIYQGCETLSRTGRRTDLKSMVVMTDGYDCNPRGTGPMSIKTIKEAAEIAEKYGITLYMIGLGNEIDKNVMTTLAHKTGGAFLLARNTSQLRTIYLKLGERLQLEQYLAIFYTTPDTEPNGSLRNVKIESEWQGIQNQGSGTYRAPLPPPPEPEPEKDLELREFTGRELNTELIPEEYFEPDTYKRIKEPEIQNSMRILVDSANEQLRAGYHRLNSTLGPIFAEWNQHVENGNVETLSELRDQGKAELDEFHYILENVVEQFRSAALEIADSIPNKFRKSLRKQTIKTQTDLLYQKLIAKILLLKQSLSANSHLNQMDKRWIKYIK